MAKKQAASSRSKGSASLGSLSFLFGAGIAVIIGVINPDASGQASSALTSMLILLGIIAGFLNITKKETNSFLFAALTLVIVSVLGGAVLGGVAYVGDEIAGVLTAILTFVIPAAIIVALKAVYRLEEER